MYKVFIDGAEGTTGLRIHERLAGRADLELIKLPEAERKSAAARAERSPTTPPPTAHTQSERVKPAASIRERRFSRTGKDLLDSPCGIVTTVGSLHDLATVFA